MYSVKRNGKIICLKREMKGRKRGENMEEQQTPQAASNTLIDMVLGGYIYNRGGVPDRLCTCIFPADES